MNMMIDVTNLVCLWCSYRFSTLACEKEIIRCPKCGSTKVGKQEYNPIPKISIDPPLQSVSGW